MSKLSEQSAFPVADTICPDGNRCKPINEGMTLRQYYAGLAMQGILSNTHYTKFVESNIWKPAQGEIGKFAIEMADELLKELEKPIDP